MNIQQFLKGVVSNGKIVFEDKLLYWNGGEWMVLQKKYHKKNNTVLYRGYSLGVALDVLNSGEATYDKV